MIKISPKFEAPRSCKILKSKLKSENWRREHHGQKREIDSTCVYPFVFFRVQDSYRQSGSPTVSAVGPHAAMVRYIPTDETNKRITDKEIYRLDAATQYKGTCKLLIFPLGRTPFVCELEIF